MRFPAKMARCLCVLTLFAFCSGTVSGGGGGTHGNSQARSVRINPYTMKYLQQLASRSNARPQQQQQQRQTYSLPKSQRVHNGPKISLHPLSTSSKLSIQPLGVKPLLVKPVYGQTYLNSKPSTQSGNNAQAAGPSVVKGQYTFAQVNQANTNNGKNVNPILVALPNLGNLLYKYAKRQVESQQKPVYNQNLYHMFGRQTYGPIPMPTASTYTAPSPKPQQQVQPLVRPRQTSAYSQQQKYVAVNTKFANNVGTNAVYAAPRPQHRQPQQMSYRAPVAQYQQAYAPASQTSAANTARSGGYQAQASSAGFQYVAAPEPAPTQISYTAPNVPGDIHIKGGYGGMGGQDWGGMLYISGPAEEIVNVLHKQQRMPTGISSQSFSGYTPAVAQLNGDSSFSQSVGKSVGAGTTCGAVPAFCRDRKPGHYTSPVSRHCFIQCDAFGRGYNKECAPGTSWTVRGPEPALYNMCA